MQIALISDIHGNLVALEAVLADLARERPERVVCLGDVASIGPQPREVIARVKTLGCPTVLGNGEDALLRPRPREPRDENQRAMMAINRWCRELLTPEDRTFLDGFLPAIEVPLGGLTLLCVHGSPRSNLETIDASTSEAELDELLAGTAAGIVACGHTHIQMLRRYRETLIVNPGSVGLPGKRRNGEVCFSPSAEYALIEWAAGRLGVDFRRLPLDANAVTRAAFESGMPFAGWWTGLDANER